MRDPAQLEAWASAFADDPLATLVLHTDGAAIGPLVAIALERVGVGEAADVLLVAGHRRESLAASAERFSGVLTHESPRRAVARRPHFGADALHPAYRAVDA